MEKCIHGFMIFVKIGVESYANPSSISLDHIISSRVFLGAASLPAAIQVL